MREILRICEAAVSALLGFFNGVIKLGIEIVSFIPSGGLTIVIKVANVLTNMLNQMGRIGEIILKIISYIPKVTELLKTIHSVFETFNDMVVH